MNTSRRWYSGLGMAAVRGSLLALVVLIAVVVMAGVMSGGVEAPSANTVSIGPISFVSFERTVEPSGATSSILRPDGNGIALLALFPLIAVAIKAGANLRAMRSAS